MIDRALAIAATPGGDLLLVRRHAPRAGRRAVTSFSVPRRGRRRSDRHSPLDAVVARLSRTRATRWSSSAIGFETTAPANAMAAAWKAERPRPRELLDARLARARPSRDRGDPALAGVPCAGVPGRRPCMHRDGGPSSTRPLALGVPRPDRVSGVRAARCARGGPQGPSIQLEAGTAWRSRTPMRGAVRPGRQPWRRSEVLERCVEAD